MSFFHATRPGTMIGKGTVGELVAWLEKYINVVFPENGIEYFSTRVASERTRLASTDPVPAAGLSHDAVHHAAVYVRGGANEGSIIEAALYMRSGDYKGLTWIKTFGRPDENWAIARAISEALESIMFWHEIPEIVSIADKIPRTYPWYRHTSLTVPVVLEYNEQMIRVATVGLDGKELERRLFPAEDPSAKSRIQALLADWRIALANTKVHFHEAALPSDQLVVSDLPGFVISKRGTDVQGFYVLPPNGNPNDDRDYLGYYLDSIRAIEAARTYQAQLQLTTEEAA